MSRPVLLLCNDEEFGRSLGHTCRASGVEPPSWLTVRDAGARLLQHADTVIVRGDDGVDIAHMLAANPGSPVVIIVGAPPAADSTRIRVITPGHNWPARVVETLIDLHGLTPALLPSYENRLRVLGRELDLRGYTAVSIEELEGGFRIQSEAGPAKDLPPLALTSRDFGRLARASLTSRGEPDWERPRSALATAGQERLLRYLGGALDQRGATQVRIVTLAHSLVVSGYESPSPYDVAQPFQELYRASELRLLQQQAFDRRRPVEGWFNRLLNKLGIA